MFLVRIPYSRLPRSWNKVNRNHPEICGFFPITLRGGDIWLCQDATASISLLPRPPLVPARRRWWWWWCESSSYLWCSCAGCWPVCMYVCVCVCMCVCMYVCTHVCVCVYACMYLCLCVCMYVCMYTYIRVLINATGCPCAPVSDSTRMKIHTHLPPDHMLRRSIMTPPDPNSAEGAVVTTTSHCVFHPSAYLWVRCQPRCCRGE